MKSDRLRKLVELLTTPALLLGLSLGTVRTLTVQAQTATPTVTPEQRAQQIRMIRTKVEALPGQDIAADAATIAKVFSNRPQYFQSSGINGPSVWAKWVDGPMMVVNVLPTVTLGTTPGPTPVPTAAAVLTAQETTPGTSPPATAAVEPASTKVTKATIPNELPLSTQARVLCTFPDTEKYASKLRALLSGDRFQYTLAPSTATVEALKTVSGDGLFYMDAHAGIAQVGTENVCFVQTATPVVLDNLGDPVTNADLKALRLVAMCSIEKVVDAKGDLIEKKVYTRYGFGPRFVRFYNWKFSRHSLVWINACYSDNALLKDAIQDAGASVYGGWTKSVRNMRGVDAGHFLLDRLLGANELRGMSGSFPPEDPPQRAFPLDQLLPELTKKGLDKDTTEDGLAELKFTRREGKGHFGLLAPSIYWMYPNDMYPENLPHQLHMLGNFGTDPGEGNREVVVGGVDASNVVWTPDQITCYLPGIGVPGSAGDVYITARSHSSNLAQLTKWETFLKFTHDDEQSLGYTITARIYLRADVRSVRAAPGTTPQPMMYSGLFSANESRAVYQASGTASYPIDNDCSSTWAWSGSGSFRENRQKGNVVDLAGRFDFANKRILANPVASDGKLLIEELYSHCGGSDIYKHSLYINPDAWGGGDLILPYDSKWNVAPGTTGWKSDDNIGFAANYGQGDAKIQLEWPEGIRASFIPKATGPNSGR